METNTEVGQPPPEYVEQELDCARNFLAELRRRGVTLSPSAICRLLAGNDDLEPASDVSNAQQQHRHHQIMDRRSLAISSAQQQCLLQMLRQNAKAVMGVADVSVRELFPNRQFRRHLAGFRQEENQVLDFLRQPWRWRIRFLIFSAAAPSFLDLFLFRPFGDKLIGEEIIAENGENLIGEERKYSKMIKIPS